MEKLSNTEAGLKKPLLIKKACNWNFSKLKKGKASIEWLKKISFWKVRIDFNLIDFNIRLV